MAKKEVESQPRKTVYCYFDSALRYYSLDIKDALVSQAVNVVFLKDHLGGKYFYKSLREVKSRDSIFFFLEVKKLVSLKEFFSRWQVLNRRGIKMKIFISDLTQNVENEENICFSTEIFKALLADSNTELFLLFKESGKVKFHLATEYLKLKFPSYFLDQGE